MTRAELEKDYLRIESALNNAIQDINALKEELGACRNERDANLEITRNQGKEIQRLSMLVQQMSEAREQAVLSMHRQAAAMEKLTERPTPRS